MSYAPIAASPRPPLLDLLVINPIRLLFSARPWAAALFGVLSFAIGTFWFVTLVTLLATGVGLAITFLGIPILLATAWLWTWGARAERARVNLFFGTHIRSSYREAPQGSWLRSLRAFVTDPAIWRDLAYLFILFPVGIAELVIVMLAVTMPLRLLTMPLWWPSIPEDASAGEHWHAHLAPESLGLALLGIPLLLLMPYVLVGMGALHTGLARKLLAPTREEALEQRVDELTVSRSRMMEAVLAERRRIERDLHDGAQQRLVALAMDLGMARVKLQSDPEAAWKLVDEAHREAKLAMVEIRNLVQGIHPAVLTDRGLDAAISALAGRSPVPVAVMVDLDERLPDTIESTAYFVVAESLTNIAKHSVATEAEVRIFCERDLLVVEVRDNGVGGADPATGSGLRGLADRVIALDGRLIVDSPRGGPTRIRAEIPCGL
jgi:signal transduction histidine kinase